MKRQLVVPLILLCGLWATAAEPAPDKLPVRRVVLYKNGVGYFEHTGRIHGDQDLKIDFTSSQLNDVLKSLTVLDLSGGKVTGVSYNSVAPIEEQFKSLRLPLGVNTTLSGFFSALRGTRMQVREGSTQVSGRLLSVEEKVVLKDKEESKSLELSLVSDAGEIRSFTLTPALSVQVEEHDLNEEIGRYLNLVGSAHDRDLRRMTISTAGSGDRNLFVSYISEVPVWKSTYRILLPDKANAQPILQGWAIVDNTVGEDWSNVDLSLVAGAPQSFIQDLARPYYTRRPVVALPQAAMLTPQTHEETINAPASPPPAAPVNGRNFVNKKDRDSNDLVGGLAAGAPARAQAKALQGARELNLEETEVRPESVDLADALAQQEAGSQGVDLGDLFEYKLKEKVTILKNHSALVPIINSHIDAEKVTLWNSSAPRALRALWVKNSSGLTLDSGAFNVIDNNTFAGEGLIDPLKPQERRLLSYAVDQGVRVEQEDRMENRPITHIKIIRGVMIETREQRDHKTYTIRNSDSASRDVILEHPVRPNWKLSGDLHPEETSASFYRFRVKTAPNHTEILKVDETQPLISTVALTNITDDQIKYLVSETQIKPEIDQALRKIIQQKNEVAGFDRQIQNLKNQMTGIGQDQQRLRENMKALKGSVEERALVQRYTRELNEQEDKLQAVRAEIAGLEQQRAKSQDQLDKMIQTLALEQDA